MSETRPLGYFDDQSPDDLWLRITRLTSERDAFKAIVSDLVKAAEPCLNAWERFECGDVEIDAEWLRSEIADGLTWGDLRSLSEAVARAGKEVK